VKFLEPWGLIIILVVVLIIFGPKRLPDLGKSMRKGMRAFKEEATPDDDVGSDETSSDTQSGGSHSDGQAKP
jgi:sec-independent protein translocase protein TatA